MQIEPNSIDAVILAGGVNEIPLYEGYKPGNKALVEFDGRPSIRYVHDALLRSKYVRDICVVGPREELKSAFHDDLPSFVPATDNPLGSFLAGLSFFQDRPLVLVTFADLPLLSGAILDRFVESCAATRTRFQDNLFIAIVPKEEFRGDFSLTTKGMSQFRDGTFCHGNTLLAEPSVLRNARAVGRINAMYAARKSAIKSALALGLTVGLGYVIGVQYLHLLTMQQMALLASRRFRVGIVPVPIPHPEVAIDVDEPGEYRLITELLSRR